MKCDMRNDLLIAITLRYQLRADVLISLQIREPKARLTHVFLIVLSTTSQTGGEESCGLAS